jgi:hypothetical protein
VNETAFCEGRIRSDIEPSVHALSRVGSASHGRLTNVTVEECARTPTKPITVATVVSSSDEARGRRES